jgi:hypothetical protein
MGQGTRDKGQEVRRIFHFPFEICHDLSFVILGQGLGESAGIGKGQRSEVRQKAETEVRSRSQKAETEGRSKMENHGNDNGNHGKWQMENGKWKMANLPPFALS